MGSGFTNDIMHAENVDFSGGFPVEAKVVANGQLMIGSTAAPNIRVATPSNGNNLTWTFGAGTIQPNVSGPPSPTTLTNHGVVIGQGTSAMVATSPGTISGQVFQSGGASADPTWSTATYPATAGTSGNVLTSNGTNWISSTPVPVFAKQQVRSSTTALVTCNTVMPRDDTIPQITEGVEVLTATITPTSATSVLLLEFSTAFTVAADTTSAQAAFFQDATANALSAISDRVQASNGAALNFRYYMTAGTTSATTFRVRVGQDAGTAVYLNGTSAGTRLMGGVASTIFTVTEYAS